jgi:ABC-type cobalamin/Fe3+-siderophores transport system ATPase subunit
MYESISIRNFRCLEELELEHLERINLIAGANNVGKTALLEAIWIRHGYHDPSLPIRAARFRGQHRFKPEDFLKDLFPRFDSDRTIELEASRSGEGESTLQITCRLKREQQVSLGETNGEYDAATEDTVDMADMEAATPLHDIVLEFHSQEGEVERGKIEVNRDEADLEGLNAPSSYPAANFIPSRARVAPSELAERFSDIRGNKEDERIIDALDVIEPSIHDIHIDYSQEEGATLMCDVGWEKEHIPLNMLGGGMSRLIEIALTLATSEGGVVLIDEIENGLHHEAHRNIWRNLERLSDEFDVQLFATTHSYECIEAAHEAFSEAESYDFQLVRLQEEAHPEQGHAVTYGREELGAALDKGFEVR